MRIFACLLLAACSSAAQGAPDAGADGPPPKHPPTKLPPLGSAQTTETRTIVPVRPWSNPPDPRDPRDPMQRAALLANGYGDFMFGPGEAITTRSPPNTTPPPKGPSPKMLVRFVHLPDIQLADDESPTKLARFDDANGPLSSAFRPQEHDQCHVINAAVRTLNALHRTTPFSFLLLGGDNIDSAQENELEWLLAALGGADRLECDSGADDDPIPGPHNDGKDPFAPEGLAFPFYWVNGNHDVLVQGNLLPNSFQEQTATGTEPKGGARDWSQPGGPVAWGTMVPADPRRKPLSRAAVLGQVAAHKDGHGVSAKLAQTGKATYTFDVPMTPLRFFVIDTTADSGGSNGLIRQGDVTSSIKPILDQAKADGKLVILASHHAVTSLGDGTGLGGTKQPDALTQDQWQDFIGGYDNVVFSIVGHSHEHRARFIQPSAMGAHGWWEVMASALSDWPHQFRLIEVWDDDNGWLRLRGVLADYSTDDDPIALDGRRLGILDFTSGWIGDARGTKDDRNVELLIQK